MQRRLASRAKTHDIGHLSHEMRTSMNAILGFGQILQLEMDPAACSAGPLRHMPDAEHRLLELAGEPLDLLRVQAGAVRLDMRPVDRVPAATSAMH